MRIFGNIRRFDGASEFLLATKAILEDRSLDLAIIEDVMGLPAIDSVDEPEDQTSIFLESVPQATELDGQISEWWEKTQSSEFDGNIYPLSGLTPLTEDLKAVESSRHVDLVSEGPIAISARVDPYTSLRRWIYVRRHRFDRAIDRHGAPTLAHNIQKDIPHLGNIGLKCVEQKPKEVFIWAGSPYIVQHAVAQESGIVQESGAFETPKAMVLLTHLSLAIK